jgi:uncharacterized membrane protein
MSSAYSPADEASLAPEYLPIEWPATTGFQPREPGQAPVNVGFFERLFSAAAGAGLAFHGLTNARRGGLLLGALGGALLYRGLRGRCSCYAALGLDTARHNDATVIPAQQGDKVEKSVVVNRSPAELYSFWREVENLPRIMQHLQKVESLDRTKSHWVACGPLGKRVEWDAEIFNDRENEVIAWRSLPGSQVDTAGSVHFKPLGHDRGTAVTVSLKYNPPAGKLGAWLATLLGDNPKAMIEEDLRNFKRMMEAGETPTACYPSGRADAAAESPSRECEGGPTARETTPTGAVAGTFEEPT